MFKSRSSIQSVLSLLLAFVASSAMANEPSGFVEAEQETIESYIQQRRQEFGQCVDHLQSLAASQGVSESTVEQVVGNLNFLPRVIELDRNQPEFTRTFAEYMSARVTDTRVAIGRRLFAQHQDFLAKLTAKYGVPGQYLVAFWGLETNFGNYLGDTPTLDALATLGCDPRRSEFFTKELISALRLLDEHSLEPSVMRGSWAGAVGHTQFMPSNYSRYAVDGDEDGRIDLWGSERDALASAANFLHSLGWQAAERWGREVRLAPDFDFVESGRSQTKPVAVWSNQGIIRADGLSLPELDMEAYIVLPAGHNGPAFAAYSNFNVIMGWNPSEFYAISVGHLADRIAGGGGLIVKPPVSAPRLSRELVTDVQSSLQALGFDPNGIDGLFGSGTRSALKEFQRDNDLVPDGFLNQQTLDSLLAKAQAQ